MQIRAPLSAVYQGIYQILWVGISSYLFLLQMKKLNLSSSAGKFAQGHIVISKQQIQGSSQDLQDFMWYPIIDSVLWKKI